MSNMNCISPSSDATLNVFGTFDGGVGTNNVTKGVPLRPTVRLHTNTVLCTRFSPDDKKICSSGEDRLGNVLDLHTGQGQQLRGHEAPIQSISLSMRGTAITGSDDFTARIWDALNNGKELHRIRTDDPVLDVVISRRGEFAALTAGTNILIIDTNDGKTLCTINGDDAVTRLAVSKNSKVLAGGTENGAVHTWDLSNVGDVNTLPPIRDFRHNCGISALTLSGDGNNMISGDKNGTAFASSLETGAWDKLDTGNSTKILSVGFRKSGESIAYFAG